MTNLTGILTNETLTNQFRTLTVGTVQQGQLLASAEIALVPQPRPPFNSTSLLTCRDYAVAEAYVLLPCSPPSAYIAAQPPHKAVGGQYGTNKVRACSFHASQVHGHLSLPGSSPTFPDFI